MDVRILVFLPLLLLLISTLLLLLLRKVERPSATTKTASKAFGGKTPQERKAEMLKNKQVG
jgi:hypothetical protein